MIVDFVVDDRREGLDEDLVEGPQRSTSPVYWRTPYGSEARNHT
jgi:hypothetical protein